MTTIERIDLATRNTIESMARNCEYSNTCTDHLYPKMPKPLLALANWVSDSNNWYDDQFQCMCDMYEDAVKNNPIMKIRRDAEGLFSHPSITSIPRCPIIGKPCPHIKVTPEIKSVYAATLAGNWE